MSPGSASAFAGTGSLVRLILRRDRVRLPLWLVGLGGTIALSAVAVPPLYDTPEKIAGYARAIGSAPIGYLLSGRQAGLDTLGGIVANEISQVAQLGITLMVLFLVVRHTRAEEESSRAELLRSTVLGRHAATLAGLLYGVAAALVIGLVTTVSMLAVGLDATGSLVYGLGLGLLGVCFAGVSLVAVQLATSARGALALGGGALAALYLLRGLGAMQDNALVWASPFGWAQRMDSFGDERWWPALLLVVVTAGLLATAAWLTAHRDFGGGMLQTRLGAPRAAASLGTPFGLALRLQRGLLIGWGVGLLLLGALYGALIPTIPDLIESNPDIADYIGATAGAEQALTDAFLSYIFVLNAVVSTGFAVASVLRLRHEEESGHAELVLATTVERRSWVSATALVALLGSAVLSLLTALGLAVGYGLAAGEWDQFAKQVGGQLSHLPAVLLVAAIALVIGAVLPRRSLLAWVVVAFVFFEVMLGETLRLPSWLEALSPFWHLPDLPADSFEPLPGVAELVLAAALTVVALWAYRRRDITTN